MPGGLKYVCGNISVKYLEKFKAGVRSYNECKCAGTWCESGKEARAGGGQRGTGVAKLSSALGAFNVFVDIKGGPSPRSTKCLDKSALV